jgi:nucleoside-diphosphate-sugar epimerase
MRICVLGGTRFVGRAIVDDLAASGHQLLIVHRGRTEPDGLPEAAHLHVDRERLSEAAAELDAWGVEGVVDTYPMTAEHAETALASLPANVPVVVLSSMDVYRAPTPRFSRASRPISSRSPSTPRCGRAATRTPVRRSPERSSTSTATRSSTSRSATSPAVRRS